LKDSIDEVSCLIVVGFFPFATIMLVNGSEHEIIKNREEKEAEGRLL
jgi:hypothetical protein